MKDKKMKTLDLAYIGLSAALMAVCAWIAIPVGAVPITLQTMAVCLVAGLFGAKRGTLATVVYLALGAIGVPVFSGFKGGIGVLGGATGGYILGFLLTALLIGLVSERCESRIALFGAMLAGVAICYAFGTAWFMVIYSKGAAITLSKALSLCVLPFIPFDLIKIGLAGLLTLKLQRFIK